MSFYSEAFRGIRALNRRIYNDLIVFSNPNFRNRLFKAVKDDMIMWLQCFDEFHGINFFPQIIWVNSSGLQLYTNSAGASVV